MSARSWSSASWYRVAGFRPRIHRHVDRGTLWYVLQDRTSGRFQRFTPETYRIVTLMDGTRTAAEIWETASEQLRTDAVTQDELLQLLGRLHAADVLAGDVPPDIAEMASRGRKMRRQKLVKSILNPLALRLPVLDPDDFLTATMPLVRPLLSWFGAFVFLAVAAYAGALLVVNWGELTENVVDRVLATENLVILLLAYPAVKAVHELGHAYAIKRWGGDVHEIGILFLVFMPVPYVDASESLAFSSKWRRALVGGAGILVEFFLAAVAMIVWAGAEEGLVRAAAFNVMLIGGVSTLFFNGNPLLRFDGYNVLCDLLEIPNFGQRSPKSIGYLVQRYGFGVSDLDSPVTALGERFWLAIYASASFLYRLFITFAIAALVSTKLFVIGIILALWAVFLMLGLPILKVLGFLLTSPILRRRRDPALLVTGGGVAALAAILLTLSLPHATMAQGVVTLDAGAAVNGKSDGIVAEVFVAPGEELEAGAPILRLDDPLRDVQLRTLEVRMPELELRLQAEILLDPANAKILKEELRQARADLADAQARSGDLIVRAGVRGRVILFAPQDLVDRFVRRGDALAHVATLHDPLIRVAVPEADADLVRRRTEALAVRFASDPTRIHRPAIERQAPALSPVLPHPALSSEGDGPIALDPEGTRERRALGNLLLLDLRLAEAPAVKTYGDRVHVRFSHGAEPVVARLYRRGMQVFVKYFNV